MNYDIGRTEKTKSKVKRVWLSFSLLLSRLWSFAGTLSRGHVFFFFFPSHRQKELRFDPNLLG
jgi:hypothetical protein